jgi:hypothetical protein
MSLFYRLTILLPFIIQLFFYVPPALTCSMSAFCTQSVINSFILFSHYFIDNYQITRGKKQQKELMRDLYVISALPGVVGLVNFLFPPPPSPLWCCGPTRDTASLFLRFLDHTQHTTVGRTSLDEWSARRKDLSLTTRNTHNRQTSTPSAGFDP